MSTKTTIKSGSTIYPWVVLTRCSCTVTVILRNITKKSGKKATAKQTNKAVFRGVVGRRSVRQRNERSCVRRQSGTQLSVQRRERRGLKVCKVHATSEYIITKTGPFITKITTLRTLKSSGTATMVNKSDSIFKRKNRITLVVRNHPTVGKTPLSVLSCGGKVEF